MKDVNIQNEDIWMSQDVMANLYDTNNQNISYHLNNIFKEEELIKNSVVKNFLTTVTHGNTATEVIFTRVDSNFSKDFICVKINKQRNDFLWMKKRK